MIYRPQKNITIFIVLFLSFFESGLYSFAESVSGNGYTVQQVIAPIEGVVSGNGYTVQQGSEQTGGSISGNGYTVGSPFGTVASSSSSGGSGGGGGGSSSSGGGGGYYVLPSTSSTTIIIAGTSSKPVVVPIIVPGSSTCKSRITFSAPIDVNSPTNQKEDVKKLETFLNMYEGETLPINGVYESKDVVAVKKWQSKYKSFILDPMLLKKPTGTIYTLSQRQIERQTTKTCGEAITVVCPYFTDYVSYGERGEKVKKVQRFLNVVRGEKLNVNGVYGPLTRDATLRFQKAYKKDIFNFFKLSFLSGNWNVSTRAKADQLIGCGVPKK